LLKAKYFIGSIIFTGADAKRNASIAGISGTIIQTSIYYLGDNSHTFVHGKSDLSPLQFAY